MTVFWFVMWSCSASNWTHQKQSEDISLTIARSTTLPLSLSLFHTLQLALPASLSVTHTISLYHSILIPLKLYWPVVTVKANIKKHLYEKDESVNQHGEKICWTQIFKKVKRSKKRRSYDPKCPTNDFRSAYLNYVHTEMNTASQVYLVRAKKTFSKTSPEMNTQTNIGLKFKCGSPGWILKQELFENNLCT